MHFSLTITFGNVVTIITLIGVLVRVDYRINKWVARFSMEHEILVRDYCERHNIKLSDLPTRFGRES